MNPFKQLINPVELNSSNADGSGTESTRQEIKVLELASNGLSNKIIADKLGNAEATVKRHPQNIMPR